jgi:octopine/nopaline transport system permease protein/arginine/ornithine transport system permease protein
MELMGVARVAVARSFAPFEIYTVAGLIYLSITYGILYIFKKVEFRLSGHLRDRKDDGVAVDAALR